jgi:hypothetical protein
LGPHDDVSAAPPLEELDELAVEVAEDELLLPAAAAPELVLLLLLLLPQPVIAMTPAIPARASPTRKRMQSLLRVTGASRLP